MLPVFAVAAIGAATPAWSLFGSTRAVDANAVSTAVLEPPTALTATSSCSAAGSIAFRGPGSGRSQAVGYLVVSRPVATQEGDLMVASISWENSTSITAEAGWTHIRTDYEPTDRLRQSMFYKFAGPAEPTTHRFYSGGTAPREPVGMIGAYSGVDPSAPIDAHGGLAQTDPPDSPIVAPSVTATADGGHLVGFFGSALVGPITQPAGMEWRRDNQEDAGDGSGLLLADEALAATGPTGTRTAVQTGVLNRGIGQVVALRPATTGSGPEVSFTWTPTASTFASGYTVRRWNGAVLEDQQSVTPRSAAAFTDSSVASGTTYDYEVESVFANWTSTTVDVTVTPDCALPARPFSCPTDPDLRACIRFDEDVAGTYVDDSGYDNTVTHTNGVLVPGVTGAAALGDIAALHQMADSPSLDLTDAMTIETWVRVDSQPSSGRAGLVDNDGQYALILYPDGLRCDTPVDATLPHVPVPTGVWFHAACSWDGSTVTLYIDGMPVAAMPTAGVADTSDTNPVSVLNTSPAFDEPLDGAMDNLRIWHSGRTQAQICTDAGLSGC